MVDPARALDAERELPEAYERLVEQADETADRLRREANRVMSHAQTLVERKDVDSRLEDLDVQRAALEQRERHLLAQWGEVWAPVGILSLPPREMRAWLGALKALQEQVKALRQARGNVAGLERSIRGHQAELSVRLRELGRDPVNSGRLEGLLELADRVLDGVARRRELTQLRSQLEKVAVEADRAAEELERWERDWALATRPLEADIRPTEVVKLLEAHDGLFAQLDEADKAAERLEHIDRDGCEFQAEVRAYAARVAPTFWVGDADACVKALFQETQGAREKQGRRNALLLSVRDLEQRSGERSQASAGRGGTGLLVPRGAGGACRRPAVRRGPLGATGRGSQGPGGLRAELAGPWRRQFDRAAGGTG
ncbi:hypothetical protein ACFL5O_10140 [Myxococcota bacterium]